MQNVETKTKSGEELLLGAAQSMRSMAEELHTNTAEPRELKKPTAAEKKKYQEAITNLVEAFTQEYAAYSPPYQQMLYWFLFARAEGRTPPAKIAEQLKTTDKENLEYCVSKFDALLGNEPAIAQEIILARLLKALEPEIAKYEKEIARNEAFDKIFDALSECTT
ncbi:MAG: hypothetical protein WAK60_11970, partial [Sedimentisphaerales bacterium]